MSPALQTHSLPAEPQRMPNNTGVGSLSLLHGIFPTQELNRVSCIAGGFFTNWAMREALWCMCIYCLFWAMMQLVHFFVSLVLITNFRWLHSSFTFVLDLNTLNLLTLLLFDLSSVNNMFWPLAIKDDEIKHIFSTSLFSCQVLWIKLFVYHQILLPIQFVLSL